MFPDHHPAFNTVMADDRQRLWVQRPRDQRSTLSQDVFVYDVFADDGVWLGSQELGFRPTMIRGDYIYRTIEGDDERGPRLERLRMIPNFRERQ